MQCEFARGIRGVISRQIFLLSSEIRSNPRFASPRLPMASIKRQRAEEGEASAPAPVFPTPRFPRPPTPSGDDRTLVRVASERSRHSAIPGASNRLATVLVSLPALAGTPRVASQRKFLSACRNRVFRAHNRPPRTTTRTRT